HRESPMLRQGLARPVRRFAVETRDPIAAPRFNMLAFNDLAANAAASTRWVWNGYVAGGAVTLLTSRWKAGKTTLLSLLLARMGAGGELAGRRVAAGRAVVVSEESLNMWAHRGTKLNFGDHI